MELAEITIHGEITHGHDHSVVLCPTCGASHSHTVRGHLSDDTIPVTLTCVNGHDVSLPAEFDARQLLFTAAMRSE
ncbi:MULTISPECIES: hypothetical protein [unclassified Streptomyces]|uniref:hypothetical protein n=1 Tax=unclassified Streptomyces TaxID=2593676 RepID=UPI003BB7B786